MEAGTAPLRVGIAGAGPWAELMHAPMLAAGPETELVGIWARRPEPARELAARFGVEAFGEYSELLESCDAVSFAVPPTVQPALAIEAAAADKALLLEKPIAATVAEAEELVKVIEETGVGSLLALTFHLCPPILEFLEAAAAARPYGGQANFFTSGGFGGPFATPWRLDGGTLLDLAPHLVDMMVTALGPVVSVRGFRGEKEWWGATLTHRDGAISEITVCSRVPGIQRTELEFFGEDGTMALDGVAAMGRPYEYFQAGALGVLTRTTSFAMMRREFAAAAAAGSHELDARRGLELQRVIAAIQQDIEAGSGTAVLYPS